jgi:hypothetical protein
VWSKTLLIQNDIQINSFDVTAVFFKKKLVFPWGVFAADRIKDAINLKSFSLHLLVVASTLIVVSGFNKIRHHSKHLV